MKKKIASLLFALCMPMTFALTGCGGDPPPDEGAVDPNPEFTEFSTTATKIMANYDLSSLSGDSSQGGSSGEANGDGAVTPSSGVVNGQNVFSLRSGNVGTPSLDEQLYTALSQSEVKEVSTNVNSNYVDIVEQVFTTPLGCGDALNTKYALTNFYGVKGKVEDDDQGEADWINESSFMVDKVDGEIVLLIYNIDTYNNRTTEYINRATINYTSQTDFEVELLTYTVDGNDFHYAKVDADYNISVVGKSTSYTNDGTVDEVYYEAVSANGILSCYETNDETFATGWVNTYYNKFNDELNFTNLTAQAREMHETAEYTVTNEEMNASFGKYIDMSASSEVAKPSPFYVYNGVIESANFSYYEPESGDGSDMLPTNASGMRPNITIPEKVTKLLIPTNVSRIVTLRGWLWQDFYTYLRNMVVNAEDEIRQQIEQLADEKIAYISANEDLYSENVDVTIDSIKTEFEVDDAMAQTYLVEFYKSQVGFSKYIEDDNRPGYGTYNMDFELDIAEGSSLFEKDANGNIFIKAGTEKILVFVNNKSVLNFETDTLDLFNTLDSYFMPTPDDYQGFVDYIFRKNEIIATRKVHDIYYEEFANFDFMKNVKNLNITADTNLDFQFLYNETRFYNFDNVTITFISSDGSTKRTDFTYSKINSIKNLKIVTNDSIEIFNGQYSFGGGESITAYLTLKNISFEGEPTGLSLGGYLILDFNEFTIPSSLTSLNLNGSFTGGDADVITAGDFTVVFSETMNWVNNTLVSYDYGHEYDSTISGQRYYLTSFSINILPSVPVGCTLTLKFPYTLNEAYAGYKEASQNYFDLWDNSSGDVWTLADYVPTHVAYSAWLFYKDVAGMAVDIEFGGFVEGASNVDGEEVLSKNVRNATITYNAEELLSNVVATSDAEIYVSSKADGSDKLTDAELSLNTGNNTYYIVITDGTTKLITKIEIYRNKLFTLTISAGEGATFENAPDVFYLEENIMNTFDGTDFVNISAPSKPGYNFNGWKYADNQVTIGNEILACGLFTYGRVSNDPVVDAWYVIPTDNYIIEADYTATNYYIYYQYHRFAGNNSNSINNSNEITIEGTRTTFFSIEDEDIVLPTDVYRTYYPDDYRFMGWYTDESLADEYLITTIDTDDINALKTYVLYPKFEFIPINMKYVYKLADTGEVFDIDESVASQNPQYTYTLNNPFTTDVFIADLVHPEIESYEFSSWSCDWEDTSYDAETRTYTVCANYKVKA